jgi:hypothetical protein
MSERLERLEREREKLREEWGGLAAYEISQISIEIESERRSSNDERYRSIHGCENAHHGNKYR